MFCNCTNLETINFGNINTSSVVSMAYLFSYCSKMTSFDLSIFDTSKVTSIYGMFYFCHNLETINFGNINTSSVENMRSLFNNCIKLSSINLSNFDTSHVTTFEYMFTNCINLSSIDLTRFNSSKVKTMKNMFYNCTNLENINFGNLNTSSVETMQQLFCHCNKLCSIDISKFDTSKVKIMIYMFYDCINLKILNLGNINTSSVESMRSMFNNCIKLSSINLSNFDTSHVTTFQKMFKNCINLKYLDLSSFQSFNLLNMDSMFHNCKSLIYLNLYSFQLKNTISINNIITNNNPNITFCINDNDTKNNLFGYDSISRCLLPCTDDNNTNINILSDSLPISCLNYEYENEYENICLHVSLDETYELYNEEEENIANQEDDLDIDDNCYDNCKSCYGEGNETYNNCKECKDNLTFYNNSDNIINCYPICNNYYYFDELNIFHCSERCTDKFNKLILDKNKCIDECINDDIYKYEYNNKCYKKCPENTISNEINNFTCSIRLINNENITQKIITTSSSDSEVIYECKKDDTLNNNCNFLNIKNETEILNIIQENIESLFDPDNGESQVIKGGDDVIYQITNTKNEKDILNYGGFNNYNLTILDLGECEDKLKNEYNIHDNDSLIFLKKENINTKSSEKDIQYEIFEPYNFTKLNLSICKEHKVNIYIPLILSDETKNIYENMKLLGYDMFNINDPFYQDICTKYTTENNTDIPLSARKEYIYNNQDSQCQTNCHFSSYIPNSLYINCTCDVEPIEEKEVKAFSGKTIYKSFYEVLKYANFQILKCYKFIFNINIFKNNICNFIMLSIFSIYLICLAIFIVRGNSPLKNKIKKIIPYLNEEIDNKNNFLTLNIIFQNSNNNEKITYSKKKKFLKHKDKKNRNKKHKIKKNINNILSISKQSINNSTQKNKIDNLILDKKKIKLDAFELNELEYEEAIHFDQRSFIKIYCDKLSREHIIIFTFFVCNDYNITYIKYSRFIFLFATDMAINVFFYSDETMHKIFLNYGKYNFIQQIPQIIYTTIISQLLEVFLCYLSLTDKNMYQIKKMTHIINKNMIRKILDCIKIKVAIFYVFTFIFLIFYWYTVTLFCAIYENTQISFIKDSLLSFLLGIIYPFIIYLIPSVLRTIALRNSKSNLKCIYKLSDIIPFF